MTQMELDAKKLRSDKRKIVASVIFFLLMGFVVGVTAYLEITLIMAGGLRSDTLQGADFTQGIVHLVTGLTMAVVKVIIMSVPLMIIIPLFIIGVSCSASVSKVDRKIKKRAKRVSKLHIIVFVFVIVLNVIFIICPMTAAPTDSTALICRSLLC